MHLLYPFFPPTQVCPSSLAALSSVCFSSVSSQAASFGTNFRFNLTTQPSVYYSSCLPHLVNQPAIQLAFFDILCSNVKIFPLSFRPREMRESPSGRNLPLAVSMTTNQSSIPAAARTAHPPGGFGWLVWVGCRFDQCSCWRLATKILCFILWQLTLENIWCSPRIHFSGSNATRWNSPNLF